MNYRMIIQDRGIANRLSRSLDIDNSRAETVGAGAEAVAYVAKFLNDLSFDTRLKNEIEKLKPRIKARLAPNGGVLLCVVLTQNVEYGYKSFNNILIADSGFDYRSLLLRYQNLPKWTIATNSAFIVNEIYIWVTEV